VTFREARAFDPFINVQAAGAPSAIMDLATLPADIQLVKAAAGVVAGIDFD
jgi:hypothetical protein